MPLDSFERGFKITTGGSSSTVPLPIRTTTLVDVVGRGTPGLVGEGVAKREELEIRGVTLVGVAVGVERVVAGGRPEYEGEVEVDEYAGIVEDINGSGVDSTDLVALSFQTTSQDVSDRASSTVSQT
jgi:hypothetical protein